MQCSCELVCQWLYLREMPCWPVLQWWHFWGMLCLLQPQQIWHMCWMWLQWWHLGNLCRWKIPVFSPLEHCKPRLYELPIRAVLYFQQCSSVHNMVNLLSRDLRLHIAHQ